MRVVAGLSLIMVGCTLLNPTDGFTSGDGPDAARDGPGLEPADARGDGGPDGNSGPDGNGGAAAPWCTPLEGTLFVHAALGNDGNDGSCAKPLRSVTRALGRVEASSGGRIEASGMYSAPCAAGMFHVVAKVGFSTASAVVTGPPSIMLVAGRTDGYVDGSQRDARFRYPSGCVLDRQGNVFITERNNSVIRRIDAA